MFITIIFINRAAKAVKILYALAVFVSYSLQGYVPFEILWYSYIRNRIENSKKLMMYEYILRFGIVIVTCELLRICF